MAIKDYTVNMTPALRPLLGDGERVLAVSPLIHDPGTTEDVSVSDELKNLLDPTILLGLGSHPGNLMQRAIFGRAVIGAPGSTARRLYEVIEANSGAKVAVTDARLLIVELDSLPNEKGGFWQRWFSPPTMVSRLIHEIPRAAILGAVAAPAGVLRRGRLLVAFSDGSGCTLVCAPPSLAGPVIAGIGAPRPDGGPPQPAGAAHG